MPAIADQKILVTGADGFVGRWLIEALAAEPSRLRVIAACHSRSTAQAADDVVLDITEQGEVDRVIREMRPTCVIHLAAIASVPYARKAPRETWNVNLTGTMNLAESVLRHTPDARFVYIGTADAYGATSRHATAPLTEEAPLEPLNPYAASKAAADLLVGQMAQEGLRSVRLRAFNHTGPRQSEQFAIPAFAAQIARIEAGLQDSVMRVGNLDAARDFLDVRDVVRAYAAAALTSSQLDPGVVINIASGVSRPMSELLDQLLSMARVPVRVEADPARLRRGDQSSAPGDAARAAALLGWRATIPLSQTLRDVLDYWRDAVVNERARA